MANPTITIKGDKEINKRLSNLRRYALKVSNAPAKVLVTPQMADASMEVAREKYKTPSNTPSYPIRWKSRKQQIAVIIRLKEDGNLPYKRTGRLETAWAATFRPNMVTIANTARDRRSGKFIAPFVIAEFQQPFHADTGWQKRSAKIEREIIAPLVIGMKREAFIGIEKSKYG